MKLKEPDSPAPEAIAFTAAIHASDMTKAAIAELVGVTPAFVSQWAKGKRPIPAERAAAVAQLLNVDPCTISASYRSWLHSIGTAARDSSPTGELAELRRTVEQLKTVALVMATTMARHRPIEARSAAALIRKYATQEQHESGLLPDVLSRLST